MDEAGDRGWGGRSTPTFVLSAATKSATACGPPSTSTMYNYAIRRLLERVSWFVDERGGEAIVTFAHLRRFPYDKLRDYLQILQLQPTQIRWQAFRRFKIDQPSRVRPLQVADLAAGCLYSALRQDDFGDFEPAYLMELVPRIYKRGQAHVTSYGMNIIGPKIRHRGPWRGLEDVEFATLEWVDWFNHRRLFEARGQIPPAEYEENHYRQQARSGQQAETQTREPA